MIAVIIEVIPVPGRRPTAVKRTKGKSPAPGPTGVFDFGV
jgi:hypothetical protein